MTVVGTAFFFLYVGCAVTILTLLAGILHTAGRIPLLADIPRWFGYVLVAIGFAEVFVLTRLLARRWRSPGG